MSTHSPTPPGTPPLMEGRQQDSYRLQSQLISESFPAPPMHSPAASSLPSSPLAPRAGRAGASPKVIVRRSQRPSQNHLTQDAIRGLDGSSTTASPKQLTRSGFSLPSISTYPDEPVPHPDQNLPTRESESRFDVPDFGARSSPEVPAHAHEKMKDSDAISMHSEVPNRNMRRSGSMHSIRYFFSKPKRLSTVLDQMGYANSQGVFFDTSRFDAAKIRNYAIYLAYDLTDLVTRINEWKPVDVLILDFEALRDLNKGILAAKLQPKNQHDEGSNSDIGYSDTETLGYTGFERRRSISAESIRSVSSKKSVASRVSKLWRSRSATSLATLADGFDLPYSAPNPLNDHFRKVVLNRISHMILTINVFALYNRYCANENRPGSSFTRYIMSYLAAGLASMPCPITGFMLTGLKEWVSMRKGSERKVEKLIDAIRGKVEAGWSVPLILLDDYGMLIWDSVRDKINGIMLMNIFFESDGSRRVVFGSKRNEILEATKKLSLEISLRSDFMVLNTEMVSCPPTEIPAALMRAHVHWMGGYKFLGWYAGTREFNVLNEVRPPIYQELSEDGIFEIANHRDILKCRDIVETNTTFLYKTRAAQPIAITTWKSVALRDSEIPKPVVEALGDWMGGQKSWSDFDTAVYHKPLLPSLPCFLEVDLYQGVPGRKVHDAIPGLADRTLSITYFGEDWYGGNRREDVARAIKNVMFDLMDKKLLASARYNIDIAAPSRPEEVTSLPAFDGLIKTLKDIVHRPTKPTRWLLSLFHPVMVDRIMKAVVSLREQLLDGRTQIWLPTRAALFAGVKDVLPHNTVWAVAGKRKGAFHIFVSDNHPEMGEAVLHLFMKYMYQWSTGKCVAIEALIIAQNADTESLILPCPNRFLDQVDHACPSQLLTIIRDAPRAMGSIEMDRTLGDGEITYLRALCRYFSARAEYWLVDHKGYLDSVRIALNDGYIPQTTIERRMTAYVAQCTLVRGGEASLLTFTRGIISELRKRGATLSTTPHTDHQQEIWALCFLFMVFWKAVRRCAYNELLVVLEALNPIFLPEQDQVAVALEMVTTNNNLTTVFGLSSLSMAGSLHPLLRQKAADARKAMARQSRPASDKVPEKTPAGGEVTSVFKPDDDSAESGTVAFRKSILNAYIFVYPIMLDMILVLSLGSGIFASQVMAIEVQESASLALLVMFPLVGAVMNSIGRTITYYFYQKSIPLMITAFYHRLAGSIVLFTVFGSVLGGVVFYKTDDIYLGIMTLGFSLAFGLFMIFFCVLIILRDPEEYFFKSHGPAAVMRMLPILIPNAFICRFVFDEEVNMYIVWGMYIGSLSLATLYMAYSFTKVAALYLQWPNHVRVTPKNKIFDAFAKHHPKPEILAQEKSDSFGRRLRRWERFATEWFSDITEDALRNRSREKPEILAQQRLKSWFWENLLMRWYIPRSGIKPPKPFSSEWDAVVKQAIAELKRKYTIEKLNRGGILFDNEFPAICFGFLYFFTLFADRWSVLFATGRALFFFTDDIGLDYVQGMLAGTIYLLLSSGFLEMTLTRFYEKHKKISLISVAESEKKDDLLTRHSKALAKIYSSELKRFLMLTFVILAATTAAMVYIGVSEKRNVLLVTFALGTFGFAGLLFGLFTKLFITSGETLVNLYLFIAVAVSVSISSILIKRTGKTEHAAYATAISGWLFAFGCLASRYSEKLRSVQYRVQVSPALTSSGQVFIGQRLASNAVANRHDLLARLINMRGGKEPVKPTSSLSDSIRTRYQFIRETMVGIPPTHIFRMAFPRFHLIIGDALKQLADGRISIIRTSYKLEADGVKYAALSGALEGHDQLLVFLPVRQPDTTDEEDLLLALESITHEIIEASGMSHAAACVSELIIGTAKAWMEGDTNEWSAQLLPFRIKDQLLRHIDELDRVKIWCNTKNSFASKACLGLDVDQLWNRKLTREDRVFLVRIAKLWWITYDEVIRNARTPTLFLNLLEKAPHSMRNLIAASIGADPNVVDVQAHSAQCILAAILSFNIRQLLGANEGGGVPNLTIGYKTMSPVPRQPEPSFFTRMLDYALDMRVAIFMALTADARFGREIASYNPFVRYPLALTYLISRGLLIGLQNGTLYRSDPTIHGALKLMNKGLCRVHHYAKKDSESLLHVSCIETYDGAAHNLVSHVVGINQRKEPHGKGLLMLNRYVLNGIKPENWKPDSAKPISRAFFEPVVNKSSTNWRLKFEQMIEIGAANKTFIYDYDNPATSIPTSRYVVPKLVDGLKWSLAVAQSAGSILDIHSFKKIRGDVVVSEAELVRKHKFTGALTRIHARYEYDADNKWATADRAIFTVDQSWTLSLDYARSSRSALDTPRFLKVEIKRGGEVGVLRTRFDYSNPQHIRYETMFVTGSSKKVEEQELVPGTPEEISEDTYGLLAEQPPASLYASSEFHVANLKQRRRRKRGKGSLFRRVERIEFYAAPYSTLRRREILWVAWRRGDIPGPFARDLDEQFLRAEPLLSKYWWRRDIGAYTSAQRVLSEQRHLLSAELQMLDRPITRTHLQLRYSDLYILGCGGDAQKLHVEEDVNDKMSLPERSLPADQELLHVINLDSGTWPTGGGGVGSCRRDLIEGVPRVRWTAVAELGSAELVQKDYPIERHIEAIIYVPLWDLDFGTPNENIYKTIPYTVLQAKARRTTDHIVRAEFVPLIEALIRGCVLETISDADVDVYEKVFVDFHKFFMKHDWTTAWNNIRSQEAWIVGWLDDSWLRWKNGQIMDVETPTLRHIEMLFDLISRLLMPLTVVIPNVPVVHASHHGIQAILGVVAKNLHGSTLVVWDHGILWRERLFGLCTDEAMPKFVQIAFAGITRLVARVVFSRADYITPCTSVQNVHWEAWLAGGKYGNAKEAAEMYARINPVLNGMDVSKFNPDPSAEPSEPTAVMLSHISPVKDVMNAIVAAGIIVRDFKLDTYRLHIYGSTDKDPPYTTECMRTIANFGLEKNVILKGLGNPSKVLPTGSIFVNSSITEGLPLALGEAGLCGLPVVCTDVGGSREVIQNTKVGGMGGGGAAGGVVETYGAITPPSRPMQLALAQLRVLAMTDGLEDQTAKLEDLLTANDEGAALAARIMYPGVREMRRNLGMKLRERIMAVFSIKRYWREHEQVLWLGPLYERQNVI